MTAMSEIFDRNENAAAESRDGETGGPDAEIKALKRDYERFVAAGDAESLVALYADEAVRMPPGAEPVTGREAIRQEWTTLFETLTDISDTGTSRFVVAASGDVAYEMGEYRLTARQKDGMSVAQQGTYVTTFRRRAGCWRIAAEIWHAREEEDR